MSEIGQQLGFYDELYEQAELIDNALLEIKSACTTHTNTAVKQLGERLIELGAKQWQHSQARLLVILLKDFSLGERREWAEIGKNLMTGKFDDSTVRKLENIASILEQEQTNVMARIKGF